MNANTNNNRYFHSSRVAIFVSPRSITGGIEAVRQIFRGRTKLEPSLLYTGQDYHAALYHINCDVLNPENQTASFIHGELYNNLEATSNPIELFHAKFTHGQKASSANELRGSFCIATLTPESLNIITDRVGSRKLFRFEANSGFWLDTDLRTFLDQPADPAGVASLLINRFTYNERTVLKGVCRLPRASIHTYNGNQWSSEEYWQYSFKDANEAEFSSKLEEKQSQLWECILRSIKRRQPSNGSALLSLSGGMDSRVILSGLLANQFPSQRISTLSYGSSTDDDVIVASELAKSANLPWKLLSQSNNLRSLLASNSDHCGGQVFFYHSGLDGYRDLISSLAQPVTAFVGDECYGWNDMPLHSKNDVLTKGVGIRSPAMVPAYYSYGAHTHESITSTLEADNQALLRRHESITSLHDLKDVLYLDQRLSNMLLPWRELHAGSFARVANPHIDEDILDFMQQVPTKFRINKRLFRETANSHLGALGAHRYAKSGGCGNEHLDMLFLRSAAELDEFIQNEASGMDEVLPPEVIRAGLQIMYADICHRNGMGISTMSAIKRKFKEVVIKHDFMRLRKALHSSNKFLGFMSIKPIQMATVLQLRHFLIR